MIIDFEPFVFRGLPFLIVSYQSDVLYFKKKKTYDYVVAAISAKLPCLKRANIVDDDGDA